MRRVRRALIGERGARRALGEELGLREADPRAVAVEHGGVGGRPRGERADTAQMRADAIVEHGDGIGRAAAVLDRQIRHRAALTTQDQGLVRARAAQAREHRQRPSGALHA